MNNKNMKSLLIPVMIALVAIGAVVVFAVSQQSSNGHSMSGQQSGQSVSTADAEATDKVTIENYEYAPMAITVKKGTTVTWTNQDTVEHTVTSTDGSSEMFDSKLFGKGETYSYTFENVGTFEYFCEPHPYMKGTVIVTE